MNKILNSLSHLSDRHIDEYLQLKNAEKAKIKRSNLKRASYIPMCACLLICLITGISFGINKYNEYKILIGGSLVTSGEINQENPNADATTPNQSTDENKLLQYIDGNAYLADVTHDGIDDRIIVEYTNEEKTEAVLKVLSGKDGKTEYTEKICVNDDKARSLFLKISKSTDIIDAFVEWNCVKSKISTTYKTYRVSKGYAHNLTRSGWMLLQYGLFTKQEVYDVYKKAYLAVQEEKTAIYILLADNLGDSLKIYSPDIPQPSKEDFILGELGLSDYIKKLWNNYMESICSYKTDFNKDGIDDYLCITIGQLGNTIVNIFSGKNPDILNKRTIKQNTEVCADYIINSSKNGNTYKVFLSCIYSSNKFNLSFSSIYYKDGILVEDSYMSKALSSSNKGSVEFNTDIKNFYDSAIEYINSIAETEDIVTIACSNCYSNQYSTPENPLGFIDPFFEDDSIITLISRHG